MIGTWRLVGAWFLALGLVWACGATAPAQDKKKRAEYTGDLARAAITKYAADDATKAAAEMLVKEIEKLVDGEKFKKADGADVKDEKLTWKLPLAMGKTGLTAEELKAAQGVVAKMASAAFKADLEEADLKALVDDGKGATAPAAAAPPAKTKLEDYKTDMAVDAVKKYAADAANKTALEGFLKEAEGLFDAVKVKAGDGIKVENKKLAWDLPGMKAGATEEEGKKAQAAAGKLAEAAIKAQDTLAAGDQTALLDGRKGIKGIVTQATTTTKLEDYDTGMAADAVKKYAADAANKTAVETTLKQADGLLDTDKMKAADGVTVKDKQLNWKLPLSAAKQGGLSLAEKSKAVAAAGELAEAAIKAQKKLADGDVTKLMDGRKGITAAGVQAQTGGTLTLAAFAPVAKQSVVDYLKTATDADLEPLRRRDVIDADAAKKFPNVAYADGKLTWKVPLKDGTSVGADYAKIIADDFRPVLRAALKSPKDAAKRLGDADIDAVVKDAVIEPAKLDKPLDLDTFLDKHLKDAVGKFLKKDPAPDAVKALEALDAKKVISLKDLKELGGVKANVEWKKEKESDTNKRIVWSYPAVYVKGGIDAENQKAVIAALQKLTYDAVVDDKRLPASELEDLKDRLEQTGVVVGRSDPFYGPRYLSHPLKDWTTEEVRLKVKALLAFKPSNATEQSAALNFRTTKIDPLVAAGLAIGTPQEVEDLLDGLTFEYGKTPAIKWEYFNRQGTGMSELSEANKTEIDKALRGLLKEAMALPGERTEWLTLSEDDGKAIVKLIDDKDQTKIDNKAVKSIADLKARDIKELLEDFLNQGDSTANDSDTTTPAGWKAYIGQTLVTERFLDLVHMTLATPAGMPATFTWKVWAAPSREKLTDARKAAIRAKLKELLAESAKNPTRARFKTLPVDVRRALLAAFDKATIDVSESDDADTRSELATVKRKLAAAEADIKSMKQDIAELKKLLGGSGGLGGTTFPCPPGMILGPTFVTPHAPAGTLICPPMVGVPAVRVGIPVAPPASAPAVMPAPVIVK